MEISIRGVGGQCAVSGQAFAPGDRVWSCLIRSSEGGIERVDVLEGEREQLDLGDRVLCKWGQTLKPRESTEADNRREALASAEEVFLSLYEAEEAEGAGAIRETRERLKFFLALQLERKRILKAMGGRRYRHLRSGRELTVPDVEITPELIARFQSELGLMGAG